MPAVNGVGKPLAGEPLGRFDGRELETEHPGHGRGEEQPSGKPLGSNGSETYRQDTPPRQLSTLLVGPPSYRGSALFPCTTPGSARRTQNHTTSVDQPDDGGHVLPRRPGQRLPIAALVLLPARRLGQHRPKRSHQPRFCSWSRSPPSYSESRPPDSRRPAPPRTGLDRCRRTPSARRSRVAFSPEKRRPASEFVRAPWLSQPRNSCSNSVIRGTLSESERLLASSKHETPRRHSDHEAGTRLDRGDADWDDQFGG